MSTGIAWTDEVWNCVVGCSRVSAGCDACYALGMAHRGMAPQHRGLTIVRPKTASRPGIDWNGKINLVPSALSKPLGWRKGKRIFVNSMSDLFHHGVPFEYVAAVFGVMLMASHHSYQILTKRPERMREFFAWVELESAKFVAYCVVLAEANGKRIDPDPRVLLCVNAAERLGVRWPNLASATMASDVWPAKSVWLGVSVEDQETANDRIPKLLDVDAAVHFVSYEPALGPVDFVEANVKRHIGRPQLGWVIVGGESGPRARPFHIEWASNTVEQCRGAKVPVFVKQLGARPYLPLARPTAVRQELALNDHAGADPAEWPAELRVQEFPT